VFETDIVPILNASCGAGDNACHSRVAYSADAKSECRGWLALEDVPLGAEYYAGPMEGQPTGCSDMDLYTRLIQLDAWQCEQFDPRVRYVVPCKPEESYMFHKMDGGPYCAQDSGGRCRASRCRSASRSTRPRLRHHQGVDRRRRPAPRRPVSDRLRRARGTAGRPAARRTTDDQDPGRPDQPPGRRRGPQGQRRHPVHRPGQRPPGRHDPREQSLVWTSDLEGQIGVGDNFNAPLTMVGMHTITLTATDIDGNEGTTPSSSTSSDRT
jgi:hypothetical protein